ncbi:hypothetical protein C4885_08080 [Subdoligranulum sp. APC924/74]|uniref:hypothetical protein n=1 Tax=Subdoligranulum sp. APC924/74 TaxID=2086273 RepID=UPI000DE93DE8|nr:hypothetical protein [Subdoligranulum sp. APC924/74]RCH51743.1 hypothetical protein C4885_08080 [Subdoligranulum sp. APC924/74]
MVEIVFSESACGSLKIAQTYGRGKYRGSAISVFIRHENGSVPSSNEMKEAQLQAQEQECIAWENAIPLGGKSSDVYCFDMALSVGDISDNEIGEQRKNVLKKMFRASYSILQDELFNHMTEQGFKGFQRGEYGSTAEHLTSLQYQIKQDKERLEKLQKRIQHEQIKYEPARNVSKTYNEIDRMGQKTITGKMAISKEDYSELTALAKEGITSRAEISELEQSANYYRQKYFDYANALERMKTKYNELKEKCRPFLQALEHFPEVAKLFTEKVKQLFSFKEAQERAEKEAREKERQERIKARRNKRGMER